MILICVTTKTKIDNITNKNIYSSDYIIQNKSFVSKL